MEWSRVPAPKTDNDPVPMIGGSILSSTDENSEYAAAIVFVLPSVM